MTKTLRPKKIVSEAGELLPRKGLEPINIQELTKAVSEFLAARGAKVDVRTVGEATSAVLRDQRRRPVGVAMVRNPKTGEVKSDVVLVKAVEDDGSESAGELIDRQMEMELREEQARVTMATVAVAQTRDSLAKLDASRISQEERKKLEEAEILLATAQERLHHKQTMASQRLMGYQRMVRENRAKPAAEQTLVDSIWFKTRIEEANLTYRTLAPRLGIDHAAVSNIVNGKRKVTIAEARMLAQELGSTLEEVAKRAGIDLGQTASADVPVVGLVNSGGMVRVEDVEGFTRGPGGSTEGLHALRATEGLMEGWTLFYREGQGVPAEAVGRLCVVRSVGGSTRLAWVKRGWESGEWMLDWMGQQVSQRVVSASPVLWIRQG